MNELIRGIGFRCNDKLTFLALHGADCSSMHFAFNAQCCARNAAILRQKRRKNRSLKSETRNLYYQASKTSPHRFVPHY